INSLYSKEKSRTGSSKQPFIEEVHQSSLIATRIIHIHLHVRDIIFFPQEARFVGGIEEFLSRVWWRDRVGFTLNNINRTQADPGNIRQRIYFIERDTCFRLCD